MKRVIPSSPCIRKLNSLAISFLMLLRLSLNSAIVVLISLTLLLVSKIPLNLILKVMIISSDLILPMITSLNASFALRFLLMMSAMFSSVFGLVMKIILILKFFLYPSRLNILSSMKMIMNVLSILRIMILSFI